MYHIHVKFSGEPWRTGLRQRTDLTLVSAVYSRCFWGKFLPNKQISVSQYFCFINLTAFSLRLVCESLLTFIIWERSPASASSRIMLSSLSSIKESRYLIILGWFSCYSGETGKRLLLSEIKPRMQQVWQSMQSQSTTVPTDICIQM